MADSNSLDENPLIHDNYIDLFLTLPDSKVQFLSSIDSSYRRPEIEANNEPMTSAVYKFFTNSRWAPNIAAMRGMWEHIVKKYPEIDIKDSGNAFGLVTIDDEEEWANLFIKEYITYNHELCFKFFPRQSLSKPEMYETEFEFSSTCEAEGWTKEEIEEKGAPKESPDGATELIKNGILTFSRCTEIFIQAFVRRHDKIRNAALSDIEFAEQNSLANQRNE